MSIQTQIDRIKQAKADLISQITAKGVTVPADASLDDLAALVEAISTGSDPVLQAKTVTPTTSQQNVTPDSGYDGLSKVTVNAMPTATQATPSIEVSTAGLITAKATQSAGYVAAGTKQATKQLTTQAAQTITPGTADKTIASGRYLTGTQTIKGDANLKAENIAEGVSIFGVAGSHAGGENLDEEITAQDTLIANIMTALEGKAAGGSGASVETCTVTLTSDSGSIRGYLFTVFEDGSFAMKSSAFGVATPTPVVVENVVCGSGVGLYGHYVLSGFSVTNGTLDNKTSVTGSSIQVHELDAEAGSDVTINNYNND